MSAQQFAIVEVESLNMLFSEIQQLRQEVMKLHCEKTMPEKFTVKQAAGELGLSESTVYEMIYRLELKVNQRKNKGRILISRDEILRIKKQNTKSVA